MKQIISNLKNLMKPQPKLTLNQIESIVEDAVDKEINNCNSLADPSCYSTGFSINYNNQIELDYIEFQDEESMIYEITEAVTKKICEALKIEE